VLDSVEVVTEVAFVEVVVAFVSVVVPLEVVVVVFEVEAVVPHLGGAVVVVEVSSREVLVARLKANVSLAPFSLF